MPPGMEAGLDPCHIVLDGDAAPPPKKKGIAPQVWANACCGQTARWIKMPFGTKVGLRPGHIVFDGNPAPPSPKETQPPIFGPRLLWSNGWIDQDATWYERRPRPTSHSVTWGRSSQKRCTVPQFSAYVYCVQTVAHLSYC